MSVETAVVFPRTGHGFQSSAQTTVFFSSNLKPLVIDPVQGGGTGVWLGPLLTPHTHPPAHVTRPRKGELLGPSLSQMSPLFVPSCPISPSLPLPILSVTAALQGLILGEESLLLRKGWLQAYNPAAPPSTLVSSQATGNRSFILKSFL